MSTSDLDAVRDQGRELRRRLWGEGSDEALAKAAAGELAPQLNAISDESVFGQVWTDDRLELKLRSLVTISALVALGRERQLRAHVAGGLNAGLEPEEIVQAVVHLAFYAGLPAAHTALEVVREVFAERGLTPAT
jgi:4-carboxymuconolactone decarboxylase